MISLKTLITLALSLTLLLTGTTDGRTGELTGESRTKFASLQNEYPRVTVHEVYGGATRIYGCSFGNGPTPARTAEIFLSKYAAALGAVPDELVPRSMTGRGGHSVPVMYRPATDDYKFTLVCYGHRRSGLPIFRSYIRLLVSNRSDYPLVLVASSLRHIGDFEVSSRGDIRLDLAREAALAEIPTLTEFSDPEEVIFAGYRDFDCEPTHALVFHGTSDRPDAWLFVADASTGRILYSEDRIIFADISGSVEGYATEGFAAEHCADETSVPMPYARVEVDSGVTYADESGAFVIEVQGEPPYEVKSTISGEHFTVYCHDGPDAEITLSITPPDEAVFVHNVENTELYRSQVNAYVEANRVRDMVLKYNPSFPYVYDQSDFSIYVNYDSCPGGAWYYLPEPSINFCMSGDSYPNMAWSCVIHHEYAHHLTCIVDAAPVPDYGEGMSDCIAMLISDEPGIGYGYESCDEPLRNADNDMQYPCAGGPHYCGQLLSGCLWDLRNELAAKYPSSYRDTLANLTVNSILLYSLIPIMPLITIDFLTLDDDDADLSNGTPNYDEICAAFGAHNMDCPALAPIEFVYPEGIPDFVYPGQDTTESVDVHSLTTDPVPGTGAFFYSIDGGPFQAGSISEIEPNHYELTLPASQCPQAIRWYVTAEAYGIGIITDPEDAPAHAYTTHVATHSVTPLEDDFEIDRGWSVSGGLWARGTPSGDGGEIGYPDPIGGHSGAAVFGYNLNGDYENDMPERHLTSPTIDCTNLTGVSLEFWRWLGVQRQPPDNASIRISLDGANWTTIWENDSLQDVKDYGWVHQQFDISALADGEPSIAVRFTIGPTNSTLRFCGWNIDDLEISGFACGWSCGDADASRAVDIDDVVYLISYIFSDGPEPVPYESGDADCSSTVDIDDVVYLITYIFSGGNVPCDTDGDEIPDC